jgi:hypothetical protein
MNLGMLGTPSKKIRTTFEFRKDDIPLIKQRFVKSRANPSIPGKHDNTVEVIYYNAGDEFYKEVANIYDLVENEQVIGTGIYTFFDGCGNPYEEFTLTNCICVSVAFEDLDFSSSEIIDVVLKFKYESCKYRSLIPDAQQATDKIDEFLGKLNSDQI